MTYDTESASSAFNAPAVPTALDALDDELLVELGVDEDPIRVNAVAT